MFLTFLPWSVLCGTAGGLVQGDELGKLHVSPSMTAPKQRPTAGTTSRPPDSVPQSRLNDRLNPVYFFPPFPFSCFLSSVYVLSFFFSVFVPYFIGRPLFSICVLPCSKCVHYHNWLPIHCPLSHTIPLAPPPSILSVSLLFPYILSLFLLSYSVGLYVITTKHISIHYYFLSSHSLFFLFSSLSIFLLSFLSFRSFT